MPTVYTKKNKPRTIRAIAIVLGLPENKVNRIFKTACKKLKNNPQAYSIILDTIHAVDASQHDLIQCSSAECNKEFIALYGDKS